MLKIAKNEFKKNPQKQVFTVTAEELLVFFEIGDLMCQPKKICLTLLL
jgi:hypothetical protein